ncbi:MAG: M48 family metalloprotease [Bryobacteraceae bacterium]
MTPAQALSQPVLVYTRIALNRRRTVLLVAISVIALLPFVAGISYLVSRLIMSQVSRAGDTRMRIGLDEAWYRDMRSRLSDDERKGFEAGLRQERTELARQEAEDLPLMLEIMLVIGAAVAAALALLYWGIARSPTPKLLNEAGAWPAGSGEAATASLLENLAIGAGLPTPKLYVIETSTTNAFTAGMSAEHAVVAVTRGALNLLDPRELEGVLAHELSHIGNHDIRLNSIAASLALFLRIPYLLLRRKLPSAWIGEPGLLFSSSQGTTAALKVGFSLFDIALLPLALYILVVAPLLGTLVRAAISREREFLADADAALLTRFPEGLMRALAKIGGAGSALPNSNPAFSHFYFADPATAGNWFSGGPLATHPRIEDRLLRLLALEGAAAVPALEAAVRQGKRYAQGHPAVDPENDAPAPVPTDELAAFTRGNPMGRVSRVITSEPVPVYDNIRPGIPPMVIANVKPGALIVAFDDPSPMRQVITAQETFGYMDRSVELVPLENVIPAEIYDPKTRAALEASLPPLGAVAVRAEPQARAPKSGTLTAKSIFAAAVFVAVLAAMLLLYLKFAG